ncbi:hypothetical protein D3C73_1264090 [compost metagenome]
MLIYILGYTTDCISALFSFRTVRIHNAHHIISAFRRQNVHQSVSADTKEPVAEFNCQLCSVAGQLLFAKYDNKVIAEAVHFCEFH